MVQRGRTLGGSRAEAVAASAWGTEWLGRRDHRWKRSLAVVVALPVLGTAAWLWCSGVRGIVEVLTFRGATGWEIESVIGSVWRAVDPATMRLESGAIRVGWNHPLIAMGLFALTGPPALWAIWAGARVGRIGTGWIAGIGTRL